MATRDLARLGRYVYAHRTERFTSRKAAADAAGISKDTWRRAEEGLEVQDGKLAQINRALGWAPSSWLIVAEGGEPVLADESRPGPPAGSAPSEDEARKAAYEAARLAMPTAPIGEIDDFVDRFVKVMQRVGEVKGDG
jgi:hypothetical protein